MLQVDEKVFKTVKLSMRMSTDKLDDEIQLLIDTALMDMQRVGIDEDYLQSGDPLVTHAIVCYCKSMFGFDNSGNNNFKAVTNDAMFFHEAYRQHVCDMLNSSHNIAAIKQAEEEASV